MRSYQLFASMPQDRAVAFMRDLAEQAPGAFTQAVYAAGAALKARPVYLQRQPFEKRAEAVRRALARVSNNPLASELLAVYFIDCRKELLVEWLDAIGLEHEDGTLTTDAPEPPDETRLREVVSSYLGADDDPDRRLLLEAFSAQDAIEWPALDTLLAPQA